MKRILLSTLLLLIVFTSCKTEKLSEGFDYGKVENNVYSNSFFNFKVSLPQDWVVQNKEQTENILEAGREAATGKDENLKSILKASEINSAYLLTVFKHEVGAPVDYNPSLMLIAENLKLSPGVKTGKDYLYHVASLLKKTQMNYTIDDDYKKVSLSNEEFYTMDSEVNSLGMKIKQRYYSLIKDGFSLGIVISYLTEEQKEELEGILDTLKFIK